MGGRMRFCKRVRESTDTTDKGSLLFFTSVIPGQESIDNQISSFHPPDAMTHSAAKRDLKCGATKAHASSRSCTILNCTYPRNEKLSSFIMIFRSHLSCSWSGRKGATFNCGILLLPLDYERDRRSVPMLHDKKWLSQVWALSSLNRRRHHSR